MDNHELIVQTELIMQTQTHQLRNGTSVIEIRFSGYFASDSSESDVFIDISKRGKFWILDFGEIAGIYIDIFHGMVIHLVDGLRREGGDAVLIGLTQDQIALFDMLGLLDSLTLKESLQDALEWFEQKLKEKKS